MKLRALIAAIAGAFVISSAAFAADPIVIPPPLAPPPMAAAPAGFDWAGPYFGANALVVVRLGTGYAVGGQFGVNFVRGNLVFGVEGRALYSPTGTNFVIGPMGKVGFALGATQRALLYATGGGFYYPGGPPPEFLFGGGAAFGLGDRISLFGEALVVVAGGNAACCYLAGGVNFHLGN